MGCLANISGNSDTRLRLRTCIIILNLRAVLQILSEGVPRNVKDLGALLLIINFKIGLSSPRTFQTIHAFFPSPSIFIYEYLPNKPGIGLTRLKKNVLQAISVALYFYQQIHAVQGSLLSKSMVCNIERDGTR